MLLHTVKGLFSLYVEGVKYTSGVLDLLQYFCHFLTIKKVFFPGISVSAVVYIHCMLKYIDI